MRSGAFGVFLALIVAEATVAERPAAGAPERGGYQPIAHGPAPTKPPAASGPPPPLSRVAGAPTTEPTSELIIALERIQGHIEENWPETWWSDNLAPLPTQSLAWIRKVARDALAAAGVSP